MVTNGKKIRLYLYKRQIGGEEQNEKN